MIAWYSRERSSFNLSTNCWRVMDVSLMTSPSRRSRRIRLLGSLAEDRSPTTSAARRTLLVLVLACATAAAPWAQTRIVPPKNSYTPAQDVELGRKAAAEVEQQMPILDDAAVTSYVEGIGRRLVAAIPADLQHAEFVYTFRVVNVRRTTRARWPA
jgi:hypothetical protein